MVERTDWKGKHAEAVARINKVEEELSSANVALENKQAIIDEHESVIADLRKEVERARIRGMHDATGLLLGNGK